MQTPSLYRHAGPTCSVHSRDCKDNVLEVQTRPRFRGLAPVWAKIQEKPLWMPIDPLYFSSFVPTELPTNIAWWEWTHERGGLDVEMNFVSRIFFLVSPNFLNYYHHPFPIWAIWWAVPRINLKIANGHLSVREYHRCFPSSGLSQKGRSLPAKTKCWISWGPFLYRMHSPASTITWQKAVIMQLVRA